MTRALWLLAFAVVSWSVPGARADQPVDPGERAVYAGRALAALRAMDRDRLDGIRRHLYDASRGPCASSFANLRLECLLRAARARCAREPAVRRVPCDLASDVIVTNRMSEGDFVSNRLRYELMKNNEDFTAALLRELASRYAVLTVEFTLSRHFVDPGDPAPGVARYCVEHADARDLSWQRCVAAIVWYIAVDGGSP